MTLDPKISRHKWNTITTLIKTEQGEHCLNSTEDLFRQENQNLACAQFPYKLTIQTILKKKLITSFHIIITLLFANSPGLEWEDQYTEYECNFLLKPIHWVLRSILSISAIFLTLDNFK